MKKDEKTKAGVLDFLGAFFISLWVIAVVTSYTWRSTQIFWMCYITLFLIGFGIIRRDGSLIASQLSIIVIPFIIWNIDFFSNLLTGNSIWGMTSYFFSRDFPIVSKFVTLQHLFTIPLAVIALWLIKLKRKDYWKISVLQAILVFLTSFIFATSLNNINCVYESCAIPTFITPYFIQWFVIMFAMILITSIIINTLSFLHKK